MTHVTVRVDDVLARRRLQGAARRSGDLRPVWGALNANVIQPAMQRRFQTAGAHLGRPWRPLSASAVRSRLQRRGGNRGGISRPLWDTNRLRAAWIKRGPESLYTADKMHMERGVVVPYAYVHQDGRGVPAREQVTDALGKHVAGEARTRIAKHVVGD